MSQHQSSSAARSHKKRRRGNQSEGRSTGSARDVVQRALARQVPRFPDLAILELQTDHLEPRDAALAYALYETVIGRWLTLTFLIECYLKKPFRNLQIDVAAVLLSGAAQILFMDRIPNHAAVDESVEWIKSRGSKRAGGLVNAILRRISELLLGDSTDRQHRERWSLGRDEVPLPDGRALVLARALLPEDELDRLSIATSHPAFLLQRWQRQYSREIARELAFHSLVGPPTILNTKFATSPLPEDLVPHEIPGHHVVERARESLIELLSTRDDLWVQDPASSAAVGIAAGLRPSLIVDVCAGQGTKTRQLRRMFPEARIIATDIDRSRRATLKQVLAGDGGMEVIEPAALLNVAGHADLALLDVPCSNTGVLARRLEARYRANQGRFDALQQTQRQIVADAIRLIRGGSRNGRMLYATCSIDEAENEAIAQWTTKWHGLRREQQQTRLPSGGPGCPAAAYTDGSFSVLLA